MRLTVTKAPAALALLLLGGSVAVEAQQKVYRIGVLSGGSQPSPTTPSSLREGLRELGWVEGKNISWKDGSPREGRSDCPNSPENSSTSRWT